MCWGGAVDRSEDRVKFEDGERIVEEDGEEDGEGVVGDGGAVDGILEIHTTTTNYEGETS